MKTTPPTLPLRGRAPLVANAADARKPLSTTRSPGSIAKRKRTATVYCEGNFARVDGKTANGLVRHSERYDILSVIDSEKAGLDAGMALDGKPNGIPIYGSLNASLESSATLPDYLVFGMAPANGTLSGEERRVMLEAISHGLSLVNGLHEFLNDDPEFVAARAASGVEIIDVRKPPNKADLHTFTGDIHRIACVRIAVLGTDCAIGKRTTATLLTQALNARGVNTVMVGTGQTGLIQGARYGVPLDAIPSQFCAGELEAMIVKAYHAENPDVIVIEGQGALSHPAYSSSAFVLRGACPQGVLLQHAPKREHRCDFPTMAMPEPASEIHLIETFARTNVIGLTLNHEHMSEKEITDAIVRYRKALGIPSTDALRRPPDHLAEIVLGAFPHLRRTLPAAV